MNVFDESRQARSVGGFPASDSGDQCAVGTMRFTASTAISARRKTATTARMKPFGAARFGI